MVLFRLSQACLFALFSVALTLGLPFNGEEFQVPRDHDPTGRLIRTLQGLVNGSKLETGRGTQTEQYYYHSLRLEDCSLKWTEEREVREAGKRTLAEISETSAPLAVVDLAAIRISGSKNSGYLVPLLTKGLKLGFVTRHRTVFGADSERATTGISTGSGFYFESREVAQKVARGISSVARLCATK